MLEMNCNEYQAIQLRNWTFTSRLANVPNFDTTLASSVDIFSGITNSDRTHHFSVAQSIYLSRVSRYSRPNESVGWKWHRLDLTVSAHVERIRRFPAGDKPWSS
jgi:hypothetical protein